MGDEKEEWGIGHWLDDEGSVPVQEELHTELIEEIPTPDLPAIIKSKDVNTFVIPCTSCGKSLPLDGNEKGEHICDHCDEIHTISELGDVKSTGLKLDRKRKKKEKSVKPIGGGSGKMTKIVVAVAVVAVVAVLGYMIYKRMKKR